LAQKMVISCLVIEKVHCYIWFHLMHANVQLIYPDFIRAGNVLHSVVAAATWYSDIMEKFFFKKKIMLQGYYIYLPQYGRLEFRVRAHTKKND
jgi:hypothetical protein